MTETAFFHIAWRITRKTGKTRTEREYEGLQSINSMDGVIAGVCGEGP
jgi:hypothetical protein